MYLLIVFELFDRTVAAIVGLNASKPESMLESGDKMLS
jgi:hypothetical protein